MVENMSKKTKYCKDCKRIVTIKTTSLGIFFLLIFTGIFLTFAFIGWPILIGAFIYRAMTIKGECPICHGNNFREDQTTK